MQSNWGEWAPQLHTTSTSVQAKAPNEVKSTRWLHLYLGYVSFIFAQWDEVATPHYSLNIKVKTQMLATQEVFYAWNNFYVGKNTLFIFYN